MKNKIFTIFLGVACLVSFFQLEASGAQSENLKVFPLQKLTVYEEGNVFNMKSVLVDSLQLTLYVFDNDPIWGAGSNCTGECAAVWPPLIVSDEVCSCLGFEGETVTCVRRGNKNQLALNGRPLYRYAFDRKAGDRLGDGLGGVWHQVSLD